MDNPDIQRLIDQVNNDVALQGRFKAISDKADFEALVSELGYELTYADFTDAELSDSELTEVAGGQELTGNLIGDLGMFIYNQASGW